MTEWRDLAKDPPTGDEWVLLFNQKNHDDQDFPGLSVCTSNATFARTDTALKQGFTKWARIPYPLPVS